MTRLIRNSADHGIEDPAVRRKAAGVSEYQIKLDKDHLLATVQQILGHA